MTNKLQCASATLKFGFFKINDIQTKDRLTNIAVANLNDGK